jgi:hypothetical protein
MCVALSAVGQAGLSPLALHAGAAARRTVHVQAPDSAAVAVVGADALPILRVPERRHVVLAAGEEEVAVPVVLDHRQRALVALDHDRADLAHGARGSGLSKRATRDLAGRVGEA